MLILDFLINIVNFISLTFTKIFQLISTIINLDSDGFF